MGRLAAREPFGNDVAGQLDGHKSSARSFSTMLEAIAASKSILVRELVNWLELLTRPLSGASQPSKREPHLGPNSHRARQNRAYGCDASALSNLRPRRAYDNYCSNHQQPEWKDPDARYRFQD